MAKQSWTEFWQELSPAEKCRRITAVIEQAQREGRHGPIENFRTVCDGCRQWVNGMFHVSAQGVRMRLCRECCRKAGMKDA